MIKVEDFRRPCGCRSVGECNHNVFAELDALDALVDSFATEMKNKLHKKYSEGERGWDDRAEESFIRDRIEKHYTPLLEGQEVDIANLAAMLWNMRR